MRLFDAAKPFKAHTQKQYLMPSMRVEGANFMVSSLTNQPWPHWLMEATVPRLLLKHSLCYVEIKVSCWSISCLLACHTLTVVWLEESLTPLSLRRRSVSGIHTVDYYYYCYLFSSLCMTLIYSVHYSEHCSGRASYKMIKAYWLCWSLGILFVCFVC